MLRKNIIKKEKTALIIIWAHQKNELEKRLPKNTLKYITR